MKRARGTFRRRLTFATVTLAALPLLVTSFFAVRAFRATVEEQVRERLYGALDDISQVADRNVGEALSQLRALATTLASPDDDVPTRIAAAKARLAMATQLSAVAIYDNNLHLVDAMAPQARSAWPWPTQLAVPPAGPANPWVMAPLRTPTELGLPIGVPLTLTRAGAPATTWYVVGLVPLDGLSERLNEVAEQRFRGSPDALLVVTRDATIISIADPERIGQTLPSAGTEALFAELAKTAPATAQTLAVTDYDGPAGAMLAAARTLPSAPLLVIAQLPRTLAFAPVTAMVRLILVMLAVAVALSIAAAWWLGRRVAEPVQRLVRFSDDMANRRYAAPLDVKTGDELETLGEAMVTAAHQIAAGEAQLQAEAAVRADLGRYLPTQLVDRVVRREHSVDLGGQRRQVTVLFADIAAFTSLVEAHPPERVATVLNELFTLLTELVFLHGGTVDKFIGDCIMAFWNAPDEVAEHPAKGVACARAMLRWLDTANTHWEQAYGITIHLALGLHTGDAVVGNFGSAKRMEYTCIGDTVNVAARLEHLARPQQILGSAELAAAAPGAAAYAPLGKTSLPGRQQPVEVVDIGT